MPSDRIMRGKACMSKSLHELSDGAERLFWRLLTNTDGHGQFSADPCVVASVCFPLNRDLCTLTVGGWLNELQRVRVIGIYEVDGELFGVFLNWAKYNKLRSTSGQKPSSPTKLSETYLFPENSKRSAMLNNA